VRFHHQQRKPPISPMSHGNGAFHYQYILVQIIAYLYIRELYLHIYENHTI